MKTMYSENCLLIYDQDSWIAMELQVLRVNKGGQN